MTELEELQQRFEALETLVHTICDVNTSELTNEQIQRARFMALYSIVLELAEKEGVSSEDFLRHFGIRQDWWHDYYLRGVEQSSPSLAAEIDKRAINACDVGEGYPGLFEPPVSGKS